MSINPRDWSKLSPGARTATESILDKHFKGFVVEPDESTALIAPEKSATPCHEACDLAERLAVNACQSLRDPFAVQVCVILAQTAGNKCRGKC